MILSYLVFQKLKKNNNFCLKQRLLTLVLRFFFSSVSFFIPNAGAYRQNRRSGRHERDRERDRERERVERERERLHAREREMAHYDINDDDLLSDRNYGGADFIARVHAPQTTHIRHTNDDSELLHDRDGRYPMSSQSHIQSSRRGDRDEYSPHRSGGNNRRVLNAM